MYCVKRTVNKDNGQIAYLKYDGWHLFSNEPLDLSGVVLFTGVERNNMLERNQLAPNEELQWYGSYWRPTR